MPLGRAGGAAVHLRPRADQRRVLPGGPAHHAVGLSCKNAILIVEFAKQLQEQGKSVVEATLAAVRLRLRPILMTSLAFGFGARRWPSAPAPARGGRQSIGTAVLGGMAVGTALGIFFVPLFFVCIRSFFARAAARAEATPPAKLEGSHAWIG
ncbi:efflux RND transporter permease subunit [Aquincola sp. J276]|nr:efflux RND transporter permease subunit [Aquincola sp. J276]